MAILKKHNKLWSDYELKRLRGMAKAKLSARLAAQRLGRTRGAVKYKAMVEGIRFHFINQPRGVQQRLARRRRR